MGIWEGIPDGGVADGGGGCKVGGSGVGAAVDTFCAVGLTCTTTVSVGEDAGVTKLASSMVAVATGVSGDAGGVTAVVHDAAAAQAQMNIHDELRILLLIKPMIDYLVGKSWSVQCDYVGGYRISRRQDGFLGRCGGGITGCPT